MTRMLLHSRRVNKWSRLETSNETAGIEVVILFIMPVTREIIILEAQEYRVFMTTAFEDNLNKLS